MGVRDEAREATRQRLLAATISALADVGYRGTSTLEVQRRADVSRGNLLHHFGSRTELMVAAVEHLTHERLGAVAQAAQASAPQRDRLEWAVRLMWSTFDGPLFYASLELWLAARSDAELLEALLPKERVVGHAIREMARDVFGGRLSRHPRFEAVVNSLTDSMRGAAVRRILLPRGAEERLISDWIDLVRTSLRDP